MLRLSRKVGERICIGDNITVVVLGINRTSYGDSIQIGIEAPRDVPIWRAELLKDDHPRNNLPGTGTHEEGKT